MDDFGIEQYDKGYFETTEGNYDGSVLAADEAGAWIIPYDETSPIFVEWSKISMYKKGAFGSYELDQVIREAYEDN